MPASPIETDALLPDRFRRWFAARGWSPREHQLALLAKARDDRSALLIAPTGAGKTLAGFLPTLVELSRLRLASPLAASDAEEGETAERLIREHAPRHLHRPRRAAQRAACTPSTSRR